MKKSTKKKATKPKGTLEDFKKNYPGAWEEILKLFGEFKVQSTNGV